jgi:hypothetical protein
MAIAPPPVPTQPPERLALPLGQHGRVPRSLGRTRCCFHLHAHPVDRHQQGSVLLPSGRVAVRVDEQERAEVVAATFQLLQVGLEPESVARDGPGRRGEPADRADRIGHRVEERGERGAYLLVVGGLLLGRDEVRPVQQGAAELTYRQVTAVETGKRGPEPGLLLPGAGRPGVQPRTLLSPREIPVGQGHLTAQRPDVVEPTLRVGPGPGGTQGGRQGSREPGQPVGQLTQRLAGRQQIQRRGDQHVDQYTRRGADQGLVDPAAGDGGRASDGEHEHRADGQFQQVWAEAEEPAEQQRDGDHPGEAPPGQPDDPGDADGDQHPGKHTRHALHALGDGLVHGHLDHEQRGQGCEHRPGAGPDPVGHDIGEGRGERRLRQAQPGPAAAPHELGVAGPTTSYERCHHRPTPGDHGPPGCRRLGGNGVRGAAGGSRTCSSPV